MFWISTSSLSFSYALLISPFSLSPSSPQCLIAPVDFIFSPYFQTLCSMSGLVNPLCVRVACKFNEYMHPDEFIHPDESTHIFRLSIFSNCLLSTHQMLSSITSSWFEQFSLHSIIAPGKKIPTGRWYVIGIATAHFGTYEMLDRVR